MPNVPEAPAAVIVPLIVHALRTRIITGRLPCSDSVVPASMLKESYS